MNTFTETNFQSEVLDSPGVVLVDVWTSWCGPCRAIAPALDAVAVSNLPGVKVGKMNMDENADLCAALGISALPTLLFFKGGKIVRKMVGLDTETNIRKTLTEAASA